MTANTIGYDTAARGLSDAAADVGALVVKQFLDISERNTAPRVNLDVDAAISVIRHARPRLVYLAETAFEFDSEIAEVIETACDEEDESEEENSQFIEHPMLAKLTKKWRKYDGKQCMTIAAFVVDSVLHICVSQPAWRNELDSDLESFEEEVRVALIAERNLLDKHDSKEVREKATLLAAHPSFNAGRTSFEKRAFLAENLFPDIEPQKVQDVTRRAEALDWLNKTGFKS
jgi:hypothetical protein